MTQLFAFCEQVCSPDSAALHPGYLYGFGSSGLGLIRFSTYCPIGFAHGLPVFSLSNSVIGCNGEA